MAKIINTDEIDESFIVAAVRSDRKAIKEVTPPPMAPLPATVRPEADETTEEDNRERPKEDVRSKRAGQQEYESLFIHENSQMPARFGKSVYIRKQYHDRISQITSVIGGGEVSMFAYIDNVLAHHFECYQEDIARSFKRKIIFK